MIPDSDDEMEQLDADLDLLARQSHPKTEDCPDPECLICGQRDCPFHEPLHYHHDGCPACSAYRDEIYGAIAIAFMHETVSPVNVALATDNVISALAKKGYLTNGG